MRREVVASLEGARIVISDGLCELAEYDFTRDCWATVQQQRWPLSREQAARWLSGWNHVDAFAALNLLTATAPD